MRTPPEKLKECNEPPTLSTWRLPLYVDAECSNAGGECAAECINDASCPAIRLVVITGATDPNAIPEDADEFVRCLEDCGVYE